MNKPTNEDNNTRSQENVPLRATQSPLPNRSTIPNSDLFTSSVPSSPPTTNIEDTEKKQEKAAQENSLRLRMLNGGKTMLIMLATLPIKALDILRSVLLFVVAQGASGYMRSDVLSDKKTASILEAKELNEKSQKKSEERQNPESDSKEKVNNVELRKTIKSSYKEFTDKMFGTFDVFKKTELSAGKVVSGLLLSAMIIFTIVALPISLAFVGAGTATSISILVAAVGVGALSLVGLGLQNKKGNDKGFFSNLKGNLQTLGSAWKQLFKSILKVPAQLGLVVLSPFDIKEGSILSKAQKGLSNLAYEDVIAAKYSKEHDLNTYRDVRNHLSDLKEELEEAKKAEKKGKKAEKQDKQAKTATQDRQKQTTTPKHHSNLQKTPPKTVTNTQVHNTDLKPSKPSSPQSNLKQNQQSGNLNTQPPETKPKSPQNTHQTATHTQHPTQNSNPDKNTKQQPDKKENIEKTVRQPQEAKPESKKQNPNQKEDQWNKHRELEEEQEAKQEKSDRRKDNKPQSRANMSHQERFMQKEAMEKNAPSGHTH